MLRLSTASFVFTPKRPVRLAAYRRWGPYDKVEDDLEAVFLRLSDDEGGEVVLGSVDTLYLTERSLSDIKSALGGVRTPLCLFATHTHNAPSLAPDLPLPSFGVHDLDWYRSFASSCARTITRLEEQPGEPVTLRYGERLTSLNVNRRRRAFVVDYPALVRRGHVSVGWQIAQGPNERGLVDPRVRALFFENLRGEVRAVVWSLAAHPAFCPERLAVSADFPGLTRAALRRRFGNDCTAVYLPGLGGSAIPKIPLRFPATLKEATIRLLPFYPTYRTFDADGYRKWVGRVFSELLRAYEARDPEAQANRVSVYCTKVPGIFTARKGTARHSSFDLEVLRVNLAREVNILGCSGEMLCEWMPLFQHVSTGVVLFSGYLAGPPFYVPTSAELSDGGYEVAGFQKHFGLDGEFHPDISQLVTSAVDRLFDVGAKP